MDAKPDFLDFDGDGDKSEPMKEGGSVKRMNNGGAVMKGRGGKFKGIS